MSSLKLSSNGKMVSIPIASHTTIPKPAIPHILKHADLITVSTEKFFIFGDQSAEELKTFIEDCEAIPEYEWRNWTPEDQSRYSSALNQADRLLKNRKE